MSNIKKTSSQSRVMSHAIVVRISKPCDLEEEKQKIQAILIALPWVLPNQQIVFEPLSDDANQCNMKVIVHGLDKDHLLKVENKLLSKYTC